MPEIPPGITCNAMTSHYNLVDVQSAQQVAARYTVERTAQPLYVVPESLSIAMRCFVHATAPAAASLRAFGVAVPEQQFSREVADEAGAERYIEQRIRNVSANARRRGAHRYANAYGLTVPVPPPCPWPDGTIQYWADSWAAAKSLEAACGDARNDPGHRCMIHRVRGGG